MYILYNTLAKTIGQHLQENIDPPMLSRYIYIAYTSGMISYYSIVNQPPSLPGRLLRLARWYSMWVNTEAIYSTVLIKLTLYTLNIT